MRFVFLAILVIVSVIHLYHSYKDDMKKRKWTKGLILPAIIFYFVFSVTAPSGLFESQYWILIAALFCSFMGDVLLIPEGHGWFTAGGIFFGFAHILFMFVYMFDISFDLVKWYIVIPIALIYYAISVVITIKVKPTTPKLMLIPMCIYLMTNSTMNLFALMQLQSNPCVGTVIAYIGAILFFTSDSTLFLVRYYKNPNVIFKKHFTVMLTYIVGEFLIAQGIILIMGM